VVGGCGQPFSPTPNPNGWTKSMIFRPRIFLGASWESEGLSIYSTHLYQGVNIPFFENQRIARLVRAGRKKHLILWPCFQPSCSSLLLSSLELSDKKVFEPDIRSLLGTASYMPRWRCFFTALLRTFLSRVKEGTEKIGFEIQTGLA